MFGSLIGTGAGAGMSLLMVIGGLFTAGVGVLGYLSKDVRHIEMFLPDQVAVKNAEIETMSVARTS